MMVSSTYEMQVTLVNHVSAYPLFYLSVMRTINALSADTVHTATWARGVAHAVSLTHPSILTVVLFPIPSPPCSVFIQCISRVFFIYTAIFIDTNLIHNENCLYFGKFNAIHSFHSYQLLWWVTLEETGKHIVFLHPWMYIFLISSTTQIVQWLFNINLQYIF
jgi:hypothetical protein